MVEVELAQIVINDRASEQIITLQEKQGTRRLPIVIGPFEARAIQLNIDGDTPPRPLTHNLMQSILLALDAEVERVVINALVESTFYARLIISGSHGLVDCDCRPSDAIALATLVEAPIFVEEEVFEALRSNKEE